MIAMAMRSHCSPEGCSSPRSWLPRKPLAFPAQSLRSPSCSVTVAGKPPSLPSAAHGSPAWGPKLQVAGLSRVMRNRG